MAFIASNSKIQKTHWRTSAHLETFTACGGHSHLSFQKKLTLTNLYIAGNCILKKSRTMNAYSTLRDNVRKKIPLPSERSKSPLSFRRRKMPTALKLFGGILLILPKLTISGMS